MAAEIANSGSAKGIQGSPTGLLICAVAKIEKMAVYTIDQDFIGYSRIIGLPLYRPSSA